jgi:protein-S-isoprenylcysteine O-methyltransferase Ste14
LSQSLAGKTGGIGWWLFRRRTLVPLPLALAVLIIPSAFERGPAVVTVAGAVLVAAGECLRLWAVRQIGVISRTRSDRLGPLVASGPFALVRNPLYLGNIALWAGFAMVARLPWLAPLFVVILGVEYHSIVRWEERLLAERLGEPYRNYLARVPRWIPRARRGGRSRSADASRVDGPATSEPKHSWRQTLYSERGTLLAIGVGFALLWLKT